MKKLLILNLKENIVELEKYTKVLQNLKVTTLLCPSFLQVDNCLKIIDSKNICLQNFHFLSEKTQKNPVFIDFFSKNDINYCIVGHSDRRIKDNESDDIIAQKIEILLKNKITPILCVGEYKKVSISDATKFIQKQVESAIRFCKNDDINKIILAYEPVFSIGSGVVCDKLHVENIIQFIKSNYNFKHVLYGGSVSDENIDILNKIKLDGFLVGKSSLDIEKIKKMQEKLTN